MGERFVPRVSSKGHVFIPTNVRKVAGLSTFDELLTGKKTIEAFLEVEGAAFRGGLETG